MTPALTTAVGLPPLGPLPPLALPPVTDTTLPSGLRVLAARHTSVPMVELRLAVPFPVRSAAEVAVADVLVAGLTHGYGSRTHADIANQLEASGSTLEAGRSRWLMLSGSCPAGKLGELAGLIGALLAGAAHREDTVVRERRRLAEKVTMLQAQPQAAALSALLLHAYGEVPALSPLPELPDVARVTAGEVRDLHRRAVLPGGAHCVVVGDVDPDAAVLEIARGTADWPTGTPAPAVPSLRPLPAGSVRAVHRRGAVQSQIRLLAPGVHRDHPRFPALSLASVVFGGYFSSRLVMSLREELGLAYRVDSSFRDHLDRTVIAVEADTATGATAPALRQIRRQLRRLSGQPPTGPEADAARQYLTGMSMLALASQGGLAGSLLSSLVLGQDPARLVGFPSLLEGVSTGELRSAAEDFYHPEAFCGVLVGDRPDPADYLADYLADHPADHLADHLEGAADGTSA